MFFHMSVIILLCKLPNRTAVERPYFAANVSAAITLAGCSSYSSMTNLYVLGLSYTNSTPPQSDSVAHALYEKLNEIKGSAQLEVRAGYFGMCVRQRGIVWLCSADANGLTQQIGPENDPLNLIGTVRSFKDDVLFSGLLLMAVILATVSALLLATFPGWHQERDESTGSDVDVKPFPARPVLQISLTSSLVAGVLLLIAGLWQHVGSVGAAAMAGSANYGNVKADIGTNVMVLTWIGVTVEISAAVGLFIMLISIMVLDRLVDDD